MPLTREGKYAYPLYDVIYDQVIEDKANRIFNDIEGKAAIDFKEIGKYKKDDWSFQREKRFILNVFPKEINSNKMKNLETIVREQRYVAESFIDVPIREEQYNGIEVTLGPCATESDRVIVDSLMKSFLNGRVVKDSVFAGKMR